MTIIQTLSRMKPVQSMFRNSSILLLLTSLPLHATPWGKDAQLAQHTHQHSPPTPHPCPTHPASALILFHKHIISPADGPRSHYHPSSSQYTLDAIEHYGLLYGISLGCDRLMRENNDPWIYPRIPHPEKGAVKLNPIPIVK